MSPHILKLGIFIPRKELQYPLNGRLYGLWNQRGIFFFWGGRGWVGERKSASAEIRTSFCPALSKPSNAVCSLLFQEVLHTICSPSGQVLRIVIFRKNGIQAMVEYPLVQGLYWKVVLRHNICACKKGGLRCSLFVKIMILAVRNHRSACQTRWLEAGSSRSLTKRPNVTCSPTNN